jgi:type IV pilus assembly protein PilM
MPAVGIDISDLAVKYIMLERAGKGTVLRAHGKVDLPIEVIERGEIRDAETIVKQLIRIREEQGFEYAHLSLPEEHAYLFQMDIPQGGRDEVEQMLEFHLKENVPIGADEAVFDYNVVRSTPETLTLNVSVYPITIALQYLGVVEEAGMRPLSVEIEGQATARALLPRNTLTPTLIVDIGRNDANLSISTGGSVTFTASLETGGDDLTRAIARTLDVSFQKAEQLKRKHGFTDTEESAPVYNALLPAVTKLADAAHKHLMYWQMHMRNSADAKDDVSRVVLAGGNANMEGITEYLAAFLDVPVEVGSVWGNVFTHGEAVPEIPAQESLEYATAVGLALRSTPDGA